MKINFNRHICNPYGAPMFNQSRTPDGTVIDTDEPLLLGNIAVNALTVTIPGDKRDGIQKVSCFKLSQRLFETVGPEYHFQTVDVTPQEITMLIDMIEKVYPSPLIYAQAREMLENPEQTEPELTVSPKEGTDGP